MRPSVEESRSYDKVSQQAQIPLTTLDPGILRNRYVTHSGSSFFELAASSTLHNCHIV
jgi:hypothetical protein